MDLYKLISLKWGKIGKWTSRKSLERNRPKGLLLFLGGDNFFLLCSCVLSSFSARASAISTVKCKHWVFVYRWVGLGSRGAKEAISGAGTACAQHGGRRNMKCIAVRGEISLPSGIIWGNCEKWNGRGAEAVGREGCWKAGRQAGTWLCKQLGASGDS